MKAVVLAAGYATRLYPLTENQAKPLLDIAGKPLIEYIIDKIIEIPYIEEIIVVSNHKFLSNFEEWSKEFNVGVPIKIIDDGSTDNENRLGAIKDISFALEKEGIEEDVLVIAGDNLFDYSLKEMFEFHKQKSSSVTATLDVKDIEIVRGRHGVVVLEGDKVIDFQEKPEEPKSTVKSMASYIFTKEAVGLLKQYIEEGNNTDAPGFFMEWLCKKTDIYSFAVSGAVYDIGNMESYKKANALYSS